MNIQPASTVLRRIYVSPACFLVFLVRKGPCTSLGFVDQRYEKVQGVDRQGWIFVGGGLRARFCQVLLWDFFLKLQRKNGSCQCKKSTGIVNCELSPQKTHYNLHYKFPGTWSCQIISTESFLMPNPLSWGLLGKFLTSLAVNGDQSCVIWGGFECGGPNSEDFCSVFLAKLLP